MNTYTLNKINKFKILDFILDIIIILTMLVFPHINLPNNEILQSKSFFNQFFNIILLFLIFFGISSYLADIYYRTVKIYNSTNIALIVTNSISFGTLFVLIGIGLFFSISIIWTNISLPPLTSLILLIESFFFGFSFSNEIRFESEIVHKKRYIRSLKNMFDHSISYNLPYILSTFIIVFPIEYLFSSILNSNQLLIYIISLVIAVFISYYISQYLEAKVFKRFEITKNMNTTTIILSKLLNIPYSCINFHMQKAI